MEDRPDSPSAAVPQKMLENYALSYIGAYMKTVNGERPERLPVLARNQVYEIEVCVMPNRSLAILFEKAEKGNVVVSERGWEYVESRVMSGLTHLVAAYPHDGLNLADAIARGKRDALRDIRSVEDSSIAKAVADLGELVDGLERIEQSNKATLGLGEAELSRLKPIRDAFARAGPEMDMLAIVDALKSFPAAQTTVSAAPEDRTLLQKVAQDVGDSSEVIHRVESQDRKLEEIEQSLNKVLTEYSRTIDERISKGLAVILQASDKKIDKGLAVIKVLGVQGTAPIPKDLEERLERIDEALGTMDTQIREFTSPKPSVVQLPSDLELRLDGLEKAVKTVDLMVHELVDKRAEGTDKRDDKAGILKELVFMVGDLKDSVARLNARLMKVEEYLLRLQTQGPAPKQRVLKRRL